MTVGERIKKRREELGLTQNALAEKMGFSGKSTISKAETCGDNITTSKVHRFADALNCTYEYLIGWDDYVEEVYGIRPEHEDTLDKLLLDEISKMDDVKMEMLLKYAKFLNEQ